MNKKFNQHVLLDQSSEENQNNHDFLVIENYQTIAETPLQQEQKINRLSSAAFLANFEQVAQDKGVSVFFKGENTIILNGSFETLQKVEEEQGEYFTYGYCSEHWAGVVVSAQENEFIDFEDEVCVTDTAGLH